jgi:hypothetical protein
MMNKLLRSFREYSLENFRQKGEEYFSFQANDKAIDYSIKGKKILILLLNICLHFNIISIHLLHETYTNLDRLAVQFLLQPRETALSCPQAFTHKLSAFFVQFSILIDPFKSLSITGPQF